MSGLRFLLPRSPKPKISPSAADALARLSSRLWTSPSSPVTDDRLHRFFLGLLHRAGSCRKHARLTGGTRLSPPPPLRRRPLASQAPASQRPRRTFCTGPTPRQHALSADESVSRADYVGLLDYYDYTPGLDSLPPPSTPPVPVPILIDPESQPAPVKTPPAKPTLTQHEQELVKQLVEVLKQRDAPLEDIFERYRALPTPGVALLSSNRVHVLLRRFSIVERKSEESMLRYLALVDDMRAAEIPLNVAEWTSAVAFAGRCMTRVSGASVESALQLFREMEQSAGIRANHATFSILFDIAAKAGKFVLAEMILAEMKARGLEMNRMSRVGLIHFYGLKADGDGVRAAYRDLVAAGDVVDTVVINCVIASLLKAGEAPAAEHVYERMKDLHARREASPLPPTNWRVARSQRKIMLQAFKLAGTDHEGFRRLQSISSLAPSLQTFRLLVGHYAVQGGQFERVGQILLEMQFYRVPLHGSIFLAILKGFALHGGVRGTPWTAEMLESLWTAYLQAYDNRLSDLYMGKWMVTWAIRAFAVCTGRERTLEVWEDVQRRWQPKEGDVQAAQAVLQLAFRPDGEFNSVYRP
ncbi:MAG: hypothetical protein M1838_006091 [Thelocarpon superellum]|nr:MAG: hypothetical protein M1838_006091 [Thelocarpon superellum]